MVVLHLGPGSCCIRFSVDGEVRREKMQSVVYFCRLDHRLHSSSWDRTPRTSSKSKSLSSRGGPQIDHFHHHHLVILGLDEVLTDVIVIFRTSTGTFDALRGRYFPGGPTPPEGMDADMMFKVIDPLHHKQDVHGIYKVFIMCKMLMFYDVDMKDS